MSAGSQWAGSKCRQGAVLVMYVCITHTHTHIQSEVNCRPTHTRPLDVTSAVHLLFYCRSPGAVYVCVCGSLLFLALRPGHVPRAYCRLLSLFLPSPCLLVLSPSSVSATAVCQGAAFYVQMICTPASAFDFFSFIVSLSLFYRTARHIHSAKHNRAADKQDSASSD